jgi:glyoxylase-like metal-dependent hydrolase (beta-lactamase superfamily II)
MYPYKRNDNLWILGNDYFHIYLIRGTKACALVETGISATVDILLNQLSYLKVKPDFIIVTHPHSDHITGLNYLKESFPHAKVIAGKDAESFIAHPKSALSLITEDLHMVETMTSRGLCSSIRVISSVPSLAGCNVVNDEEELNLGNITIRFLEVKGHSPGNIIVQIPDIDTALVSDSLGNHYPGRGFYPTFFTGYTDYMATIDHLENLNPKNLGLAHNGFFSSREEIKNIFQKARQCANDVRNYIIETKKKDEEIAKDLFTFYYTDELAVYSPQNILNCCRLLVRRIRELNTNEKS